MTVEIATYSPSLADFTDRAIAAGILIALSVLAMSVGLIRSETAPDLRTLTATGASGATRGRSPPRPPPRSACSAPSSAWPAR